jgi:hypothetical protein
MPDGIRARKFLWPVAQIKSWDAWINVGKKSFASRALA